jgi:hypothetical protein
MYTKKIFRLLLFIPDSHLNKNKVYWLKAVFTHTNSKETKPIKIDKP